MPQAEASGRKPSLVAGADSLRARSSSRVSIGGKRRDKRVEDVTDEGDGGG